MASETSLSSKSIAYALLAIVGTVVLYLYGFSRGITQVTQASQERANNQATIGALQKKLSDLKNLQQQFATAQERVNALSVAMPAEKQIAEVVAMFETMAARAGVILENLQPSPPTADGLPMAVTIRGSYNGVLSFVEIMEKNVRPFLIGPINISGGETELSTTFNVVALYQVPAKDLPAEAAPAGSDGTPQ